MIRPASPAPTRPGPSPVPADSHSDHPILNLSTAIINHASWRFTHGISFRTNHQAREDGQIQLPSKHIDPNVLEASSKKQAEDSVMMDMDTSTSEEPAGDKVSNDEVLSGNKNPGVQIDKDSKDPAELNNNHERWGKTVERPSFQEGYSIKTTTSDEAGLNREQLIELKREQYAKIVARTYQRLKTTMAEEGLDENKEGIEGEVNDLTGSLARVKFSLDQKAAELDRLITSNEPEIQITSALIVVSDSEDDNNRPRNVATKRKVPMGKAKAVTTQINPAIYFDLEAKEGHSDDDEKKRPSKKLRSQPKSTEFVTAEDDPKVDQPSKKEEIVEAKAIKKAKKSDADKPKKPAVYKVPESEFSIFARKNVDITVLQLW
ncbi:uncharacterized protein MELLADRAFT_86123 [Melampsora larici-populina 98AG31]|uniref:Uncharacterized protein n=1 Tax=Melampsora larici-populina (strain 98AG31 / pathotype 3-4-7) TaxID=747676 RepID=F4SDL2_MELLP|nr:uncharacterized protein MELLADRAFT_86123 [Melampsora larici-populina 98AG31]EGF97264.1 hypothetical protein MELLADRAFT_86123 [Melampsora larici-populina 98AG31]